MLVVKMGTSTHFHIIWTRQGIGNLYDTVYGPCTELLIVLYTPQHCIFREQNSVQICVCALKKYNVNIMHS